MSDPLRGLDQDAHLRDPSLKQRYVTTLFDTIAGRYDRFTRWFSFGMDQGWKRDLSRRAGKVAPPGAVVLDLACGTGDLLLGLADLGGGSRVTGDPARFIGMDVSRQMIRRARTRAHRTAAWLTCGDMMSLPFRSSSVDVVTVGYGMRNVPVLAVVLREVARVLKPGGWLFSLDFFLPDRAPWRRAFLAYLAAMGRLYGYALHRNGDTYRYIARSLERWMRRSRYEEELRDAGFEVGSVRSTLGGGIVLHETRARAERTRDPDPDS